MSFAICHPHCALSGSDIADDGSSGCQVHRNGWCPAMLFLAARHCLFDVVCQEGAETEGEQQGAQKTVPQIFRELFLELQIISIVRHPRCSVGL